jgi:hypothetical protein
VAHEKHLSVFHLEHVGNPLRRIVRPKTTHHHERREWIADAKERFGCLPGAKLPAVPDDSGTYVCLLRLPREAFGLGET